MKLDLAKLPVAEAVIGFFVLAMAVTFYLAFDATSGGGEGAADESPSPVATSPGASPGPGGPVQVALHDNSFDPKDISVKAGEDVTFDIENKGAAIHNLHIQTDGKYNDSFCKPTGTDPCSDPNTIAAGATATLEWTAPSSAGSVAFRCDFHPQEMTGTITVQ